MKNKTSNLFHFKKSHRSFLVPCLFFILGALFTSFTQNHLEKASLSIETFPVKHYSGFSVQYHSKNKIPLWTYEKISSKTLKPVASRSSMRFHKDPSLYSLHQSQLKDYYKSGYDRGHMAAAANQQSSREALKETFLLSNVCPQNASLNRGLWAKLEANTRKMAKTGEVEVITGPLFLSSQKGNKRYISYEVIGENEVAVPTHFFKLILNNGRQTAYIIPNEAVDPQADLEQFQVSVSNLEKASGLRFRIK